MCGIAGIIGYPIPTLEQMLRILRHRGPDNSGIRGIDGTECHLGHLRLSIIDLDPRSNQPFVSTCGRYTLVFNGEIYNFQELKSELQAADVGFRTTSDTEVLLLWLIRHGVAGLKRLDGMFAFGLADSHTKTLLLARDPIGEKPLYYTSTSDAGDQRFAFASEIKGLVPLESVDRSLDRTALLDYLRFLYTAPPNTLYRGIRELPPGHVLSVSLCREVRQPRPQPYYRLEDNIEMCERGDRTSAIRRVRSLVEQSVALRLVSDVNIGLLLSSGLDSNTILAAARQNGRFSDLYTFTLEYTGHYNESEIVRRVLARAGLRNVAIPFKELEFRQSVERVVDMFDQPFGNSTAIVSDLIAAEAAKLCKVCLAGDGGDEIAVGYPRYHALPWLARLNQLPMTMRRCAKTVTSLLPESGRLAQIGRRSRQFMAGIGQPLAEVFLNWSTYLDTRALSLASGMKDCETPFFHDLLSTFERYRSDPIRAATIVDMKSFVPYNLMQNADRTSMAHSLELRSPFLATPLVHFALGLPSDIRASGTGKALLRDGFAAELAPEVRRQGKRPFNPPIREMLTDNVRALEDHLVGSSSVLGCTLEPNFVRAEVDAFSQRRRDNSTLLWGMATLESWLRRRA